MAKSMRSKSKRAFRRTKREEGVYAAAHAARLERLSAKLVAKVSADKDGDQDMEEKDEVEEESGGERLSISWYWSRGVAREELCVMRLVLDSATSGEDNLNILEELYELTAPGNPNERMEDGDIMEIDELCHLVAGLNLFHDEDGDVEMTELYPFPAQSEDKATDMDGLCHSLDQLSLVDNSDVEMAGPDAEHDIEMDDLYQHMSEPSQVQWVHEYVDGGNGDAEMEDLQRLPREDTEMNEFCELVHSSGLEPRYERMTRGFFQIAEAEVEGGEANSVGGETGLELVTPAQSSQLEFIDPSHAARVSSLALEYASSLAQPGYSLSNADTNARVTHSYPRGVSFTKCHGI
ncbi:unnamed protein product [Rhizoctonia solani]|uniref:DUF2423 domain-containing protein n=1 Tax=Rhizoctonia solani TaxID=456999 RepID=A0A8H3DC62_9AGAM|nr:unnamed protein product [Rhizoctonia solani]